MEECVKNLRSGWRLLWRSPGFTAVCKLTLAIGIGGNTAFIAIRAVLLKPLGYQGVLLKPDFSQVMMAKRS
jgi:hypothetical protein